VVDDDVRLVVYFEYVQAELGFDIQTFLQRHEVSRDRLREYTGWQNRRPQVV
jgi:hypothetical protein